MIYWNEYDIFTTPPHNCTMWIEDTQLQNTANVQMLYKTLVNEEFLIIFSNFYSDHVPSCSAAALLTFVI